MGNSVNFIMLETFGEKTNTTKQSKTTTQAETTEQDNVSKPLLSG